MSNFFVRGSKAWGILNSWWILLTLVPFGVASFLAFLYVGFKGKIHRWKISGCVYLVVAIVFFNVPLTDAWLAVFLLSWIISIIHAFKIRSSYLGYLKVVNTNLKAPPTRFREQEDRNLNVTEGDGPHPPNKTYKSTKEIFEFITLTGTERKARNEIRKQMMENPNSLNLIKKGFERTGELKHPLLISFKEKVLLELRIHNDFNKLEDIEIESYIEDELVRYVRKNSKLKVRTMPSVLKGNKSKTFIRRFPSVFLILLTLIYIHILTYIYGNGSADVATALRFGAINSGDTSPDQWLRLASHIFVQTGGTYHLLVYVAAILILAPPLERIYGSAKLPLLFLLTGITGGFFIITSSVGTVFGDATASLFGLVGLHIGLLLKRNQMIHSENKGLIWSAVIGIVLFTMIEPNLPISAHLGGFFSGMILAFLVTPQSFKRFAKTDWHLAIFQTIMVSFVVLFILCIPRYFGNTFNGFFDSHSKIAGAKETEKMNKNPQGSTEKQKEAVINKTKENSEKVNELIISAETHIANSEFSLAKEDLENVLKLDSSSEDAVKLLNQVQEKINEQKKAESKKKNEEEKKKKDEAYFNSGVALMNSRQSKKAIKELKKVSKNSEKYKEAQTQIKTMERNLYLEGALGIYYKELQKSPEDYKATIIHLYGRIYNIQEINGKTILTLSTTQDEFEVDGGDEAVILFPKTTPLQEGDYIHIYGEMLGNYSKNNQYITRYLNADQYTIYFDQRTFIEQAPVLKTKIIKDINENIYE